MKVPCRLVHGVARLPLGVPIEVDVIVAASDHLDVETGPNYVTALVRAKSRARPTRPWGSGRLRCDNQADTSAKSYVEGDKMVDESKRDRRHFCATLPSRSRARSSACLALRTPNPTTIPQAQKESRR